MNTPTPANQPPTIALLGIAMDQTWEPVKRHSNGTAVSQVNGKRILCDRHSLSLYG